jgi:hypothetical protein
MYEVMLDAVPACGIEVAGVLLAASSAGTPFQIVLDARTGHFGAVSALGSFSACREWR